MEPTTTLPKTLLVTNDYPPRVGGIQRTLEALWKELPPERVSVLAPMWEGAASFDAAAPYRIVREPTEFIWPTPAFAARLDEVVAAYGVEVVLFGDAFPLALLGPRLARRGTPYLVAAHGFDYWLSIVPGAHASLRYMTSSASRVPVMCSEFIARTVRTAVPRRVAVSILYPGADLQAFRPDLPTADLRERMGVGDRPLVVCVSRLVARKGQDVLIVAMQRIRERVSQATLVIVRAAAHDHQCRLGHPLSDPLHRDDQHVLPLASDEAANAHDERTVSHPHALAEIGRRQVRPERLQVGPRVQDRDRNPARHGRPHGAGDELAAHDGDARGRRGHVAKRCVRAGYIDNRRVEPMAATRYGVPLRASRGPRSASGNASPKSTTSTP